MKVNTLKSPPVNQNGYHKNSLTKERIGTLFIYPIDYTPDDCLSCDGYSLQITDFEDLYKVIGTKFNQSGDATGTFRVPDYNVTKRFLHMLDTGRRQEKHRLHQQENRFAHHTNPWSIRQTPLPSHLCRHEQCRITRTLCLPHLRHIGRRR